MSFHYCHPKKHCICYRNIDIIIGEDKVIHNTFFLGIIKTWWFHETVVIALHLFSSCDPRYLSAMIKLSGYSREQICHHQHFAHMEEMLLRAYKCWNELLLANFFTTTCFLTCTKKPPSNSHKMWNNLKPKSLV